MVFSFFKKKGSGSERPREPVRQRSAPKPSGSELDLDPHSTVEGIEVSDAESGLSGVAQEATILYANGRADAAIDVLLQAIAEPDGARRSLQSWFMLFDLFQLQGMRQEFEKLALDFAVEFERSSPAWTEQDAAEAKLAAPASDGPRAAQLALGGRLSGESRRQIADMEQAAGRDGALRLDVAKLKGLDDEGCTLLLEALARMETLDRRVTISGTRNLEKLLRAETEGRGKSCSRNVWLLLLKLYQIKGMQQEFENLSLDYAVAYEVSPPPWDASQARKAEPISGEFSKSPQREPPVEALRLSGTLTGARPHQLNDLYNYAASHALVNIDMSLVNRVDFVAAGALLNAFMSLAHNGKGIMIHGANEMIQALFTIVGVNQYVVVARNKQH
ncbi:MAG TPA: STAS domain-containing protein [Burkholderiales bacterium]|nr:STAS domain-containing protein [Burkholderiales bacterium]